MTHCPFMSTATADGPADPFDEILPFVEIELHADDADGDAVTYTVSSDDLVALQGRYYQRAIEAFGPSRCMFESNFPVDKFSVSYTVLWNAFKKMSADLSESEKDRLFRGTASEFYRLQLRP